MKFRRDFVTNSSSSSYITVTVTTADGVFVGQTEIEDYTYPSRGLLTNGKGIIPKDLSSIYDLLNTLETEYDDFISADELEETDLGKIGDFSKVEKIVIADEVNGDMTDGLLELSGEYDPNASMKAVETFDLKSGDHFVKTFVEDYDEDGDSTWVEFEGFEDLFYGGEDDDEEIDE